MVNRKDFSPSMNASSMSEKDRKLIRNSEKKDDKENNLEYAFEDEKTAKDSAKDMSYGNNKYYVKKLKEPQDSGRLKYGVYKK